MSPNSISCNSRSFIVKSYSIQTSVPVLLVWLQHAPVHSIVCRWQGAVYDSSNCTWHHNNHQYGDSVTICHSSVKSVWSQINPHQVTLTFWQIKNNVSYKITALLCQWDQGWPEGQGSNLFANIVTFWPGCKFLDAILANKQGTFVVQCDNYWSCVTQSSLKMCYVNKTEM